MKSAFFESQICAVKDQVSSELGGEAVILHVKSGSYYGLNEVGTRIWSLIQEPTKIAFIRDEILGEYDVEPSQLDDDLEEILNQLVERSLVEISDGTVS